MHADHPFEKDFNHYLEEKKQLINTRIQELVPESIAPEKILFEAARYSLNSPGKRIRPILTLAAAEMLGAGPKSALTPACAIEMVHTYSMIHDDLPCMDDDDFRRGRPTLHRMYPEAVAVLAGDFLLTHSFQIISEDPVLTDTQKIALIRVLAKDAGGSGMIAGQILDIDSEKKSISMEALRLIHSKKTGALIAASLEFGAIAANATDETRLKLRDFGKKIGLAFQIADDVLDVTNSKVKHGKEQSTDIERQKSTYAAQLGTKGAQREAVQLIIEAIEGLESVPGNPEILIKIARYIVERDR